MASKLLFVYTLLTFLLYFHGLPSAGMEYIVINEVANTPAGIKFTKEVGIPFTKQLLPKAVNYVCSTILQQNPSERRKLDALTVYITKIQQRPVPVDIVGMALDNVINISADFIQATKSEEMRWYFEAVMYHEVTHIFQFDGEGQAPVGLTEGIAEYTMLKSNYVKPGFLKPGEGDRWNQGYAVTARFLEYCDGLIPGFVAKINKKIRKSYDVSFFKELTGKPVEQLWKEYKAKYGKKN